MGLVLKNYDLFKLWIIIYDENLCIMVSEFFLKRGYLKLAVNHQEGRCIDVRYFYIAYLSVVLRFCLIVMILWVISGEGNSLECLRQ